MISEFAPAKVNLALHVTGQRDNGYHELDSFVVLVNVGDNIRLSPSPEFTLSATGPFAQDVPLDHSNLVAKAALALAQHCGRTLDVHLELEKNLPPASGIGGGSSDAAATIRALCRYWGISLPDVSFLASIGADVPVCMCTGPTRMSGIGEILAPINLSWDGWMILVNPRTEVSTPAVFSRLPQKFNQPMTLANASGGVRIENLREQRNDLQSPAISAAPVIGRVLDEISACAGVQLVRMSGSGATCFGLWSDQILCDAALDHLTSAHPDWWIAKCQILG